MTRLVKAVGVGVLVLGLWVVIAALAVNLAVLLLGGVLAVPLYIAVGVATAAPVLFVLWFFFLRRKAPAP